MIGAISGGVAAIVDAPDVAGADSLVAGDMAVG